MNDDELAAISVEKLRSRASTRAVSARARGDEGEERFALDDLILLDSIEADRNSVRAELEGARATIDHMSEAMSWIGGHDRQGLDHLDEAMQASAERDAAVAALAEAHRALAALGNWAFTIHGGTKSPADVWPGIHDLLAPYRPGGEQE